MMGEFFAYSLKSAGCLVVFYLFYKLLLSRDTFHRFNRITLLSIMVLSLLLPCIAVSGLLPPVSLPQVTDLPASDLQHSPSVVLSPTSSYNSLLSIILLCYLTGCCVCLIRFFWNLFHILRLVQNGDHIRLDHNILLTVHADHRITPFSWKKNIVISRADMNEAGDTILLHEKAHIHAFHSFDLMLAELFLIFQWYNPAAWLLFAELKNLHEFEADRFVLDQGIDAKQYQLLIIKKAVGTRLYSMANSFNHSNLKKRITMMLQKKSNSWARLKYAYVLPLAAIAVIAFARPEISQPFDEISNAKVSNLILKVDPVETEIFSAETIPLTDDATLAIQTVEWQVSDTTIYDKVDIMPEFPGGMHELMAYLNSNLIYPKKAIEDKLSGRVTIKFVVEKDGSLSNITFIREISPELDAEALRVVQSMPKWIPGKQGGNAVRVWIVLPIMFRLNRSGR